MCIQYIYEGQKIIFEPENAPVMTVNSQSSKDPRIWESHISIKGHDIQNIFNIANIHNIQSTKVSAAK